MMSRLELQTIHRQHSVSTITEKALSCRGLRRDYENRLWKPMDRLQHYSIVAGGDCRCWQTRAETRVQGHSRHSEHHQTRRRYYLSNGCGLNFIMPSTLSDRPLIIIIIKTSFVQLNSTSQIVLVLSAACSFHHCCCCQLGSKPVFTHECLSKIGLVTLK